MKASHPYSFAITTDNILITVIFEAPLLLSCGAYLEPMFVSSRGLVHFELRFGKPMARQTRLLVDAESGHCWAWNLPRIAWLQFLV